MDIKRKFIAFTASFCFAVLCVLPAAAQQDQPRQEDRWGTANTSELYYVNVPVEKVYSYRLGYIVLFRKGNNSLGRAYIPYEWFRAKVASQRKADLVMLQPGANWPTMSVFYKDGAFHSVRLYVSRENSHITWGTISTNTDLDRFFEGVESIDLSVNEK